MGGFAELNSDLIIFLNDFLVYLQGAPHRIDFGMDLGWFLNDFRSPWNFKNVAPVVATYTFQGFWAFKINNICCCVLDAKMASKII